MNRYVFAHALKITAPVFFGYIAIGIGFGMLLANAGYPWWLAVLSGVVMYTGSGQYFIVGQLASGASFVEIILVQFLLSIRHVSTDFRLFQNIKMPAEKSLILFLQLRTKLLRLFRELKFRPV